MAKQKKKISKSPCLHCKQLIPIRRIGLCFLCHETKKIRVQYDLVKPTTALPGTEEKIIVMQQRADMMRPLFHPDDWIRPLGEWS